MDKVGLLVIVACAFDVRFSFSSSLLKSDNRSVSFFSDSLVFTVPGEDI